MGRRIVLPLSRIILLLIVGGIFIFRGVVGLASGTADISMPLFYILIGAVLAAVSAIALVFRFRSQKSQIPDDEGPERF
jgi:hypothetical protein